MRQDEIHKLELKRETDILTVSYPTQKGDNGIMLLSPFSCKEQ